MLDTLIESEKTSIYARDVINYEGNDHILVKELKRNKNKRYKYLK